MASLRGWARILEAISVGAGIALAWLGIPVMIATAALEPLLRWSGARADAPLSEASTVAFLAVTMTSFGYAYAARAHVRLDVSSRRFTPRARAAIELAGVALVLLPLCALVVAGGADSAWRSYLQGETWAGSGWPLQWAVRFWVPFGFALLLIAALASALRALLVLVRK